MMKIEKIKVLYLILLISTISLTAVGLLNLNRPIISLFNVSDFLNFVYFIIGVFLILLLLSKILKLSHFVVFCIFILLLISFTNNIYALIPLIYFLVSAYAVGRLINKYVNRIVQLEHIFCCVIGLGIYGVLTGLLAHFKISNEFTYWVILTIPIIWLLKFKTLKNLVLSFDYRLKINYQLLIIYSIISFYVVISLMPEIGYDALAMHLLIPGHMKYRGFWGFDVDKYAFAVMPILGDWIYSLLFIIGNETTLRLFNVFLLGLLALVIRQIVLIGIKKEKYSLWAILFFLSSPLTFTETSSLFIDNTMCLFVLSSFAIALKIISSINNKPDDMMLIGLLMGFSVATKSTGFLYNFCIILLLLIFSFRWFKCYSIKNVLQSFILAIVIGCIPYINAYLIAGNPFFPFYNGFFKSSHYVLSNFDNPIYKNEITFSTLYDLTFHSAKYLESGPGAGGFILLLLLVPMVLLLFFKKNTYIFAVFLGALLSFFSIFYFQTYLRYVYPVYALLYAFIALSFSKLEGYSNTL